MVIWQMLSRITRGATVLGFFCCCCCVCDTEDWTQGKFSTTWTILAVLRCYSLLRSLQLCCGSGIHGLQSPTLLIEDHTTWECITGFSWRLDLDFPFPGGQILCDLAPPFKQSCFESLLRHIDTVLLFSGCPCFEVLVITYGQITWLQKPLQAWHGGSWL
jgi:hypothetical protein